MPKQLMNEAERFLLEHWEEARRLEESMDAVRTKYKEVFERIVEAVTEGHPELNANGVHLTQSWTEGQLGFGRSAWPNKGIGFPAGLWVVNLRLELLTVEDSDAPCASIWVPKRSNLDFDAARLVVNAAAKTVLAEDELKRTECEESGETMLWLPAPPKRDLLTALLDGDGQRFVAIFVSQFDLMARFIPILDQVFRECAKKE
jgi:hypothetical protein